MDDFLVDKDYSFTGSLGYINRKQEIHSDKAMLGKFIRYFNIANHGEYYENGKAEFEYGFIDFPYYDLVKEIKLK